MPDNMHMLFFFVDGLGLGPDNAYNPARNLLDGILDLPLSAESAPADLPGGILRALDATGGVPGLPQSASGQASLVTGRNISAFLGYHLTALPNDLIAGIILKDSVMKTLKSRGLKVTSSNLYTPEFFSRREDLENDRGHNTFPVSTLTIQAAGVPFRMPEDYHADRAVFSDLTNRFLKERGADIDLIEPEAAALHMLNILDEADFVYHEYFVTDTYAHKRRYDDLERALMEINRFLRKLVEHLNPYTSAVLLISDHGNCEDTSSADHNRNSVPLVVISKNETVREAFRHVKALEDVRAAVTRSLCSSTHFSGQERPSHAS